MNKFYNDTELKEIGLYLKSILDKKVIDTNPYIFNDIYFKSGYNSEGFYSFKGYTKSNFVNTFFDNKVNYEIDAEIPLDKTFVRFYFKSGATKEFLFKEVL